MKALFLSIVLYGTVTVLSKVVSQFFLFTIYPMIFNEFRSVEKNPNINKKSSILHGSIGSEEKKIDENDGNFIYEVPPCYAD